MNAFEEQVINAPGNAPEKMRRLYGFTWEYSEFGIQAKLRSAI